MSVSSSNEVLHIWKSYNETNSQFLELYRSFQPQTNPVASSARTSTNNNRRNRASLETSSLLPLLQQLFSSGRSPYISDISYSWIFEVPTTTTTTASSSSPVSRLTQKQIQENTRAFVYNERYADELITTTCPISHNDFQTGDILCEINNCKHVFKQGDILRWFDVNTSCPVCRTPVVSNSNPSTATTTTTTSNSSHILDEIILTPLFPSSSNSQSIPSSIDNDQMTQFMNEALESIFSRNL